MKIKLTNIVALLLVAFGLAAAAQADMTYPVEQIEDGDTIVVKIDGRAERIQLLGIDAPEDSDNPKFKLDLEKTGFAREELLSLGQAATEHLGSLAGVGQTVTLRGDISQKDRYGRIPAIVINADGRPLAEDMVRDGYAVALPNASMAPDYAARLDRLERFSRKSGNGLWQSHALLMRQWYERTR